MRLGLVLVLVLALVGCGALSQSGSYQYVLGSIGADLAPSVEGG